VKITVDVTAKVVAQIDAAMAADGKKPYGEAAMFYLNHDLDLKKAAGWMDAALAEQPNAFWLVYHKARLLAKMGDKAGAIAAAKASIDLVAKSTGPEKGEYTRLNEALIASLQ
jgi:predicted Zn-dependent protease